MFIAGIKGWKIKKAEPNDPAFITLKAFFVSRHRPVR